MGKFTEKAEKPKLFEQRLDFYWQYIAVYLVVLIIYAVMMGSISEGKITFRINDPVALLLLLFIVSTAIGMLFRWIKKLEIIIGKDYLVFRNRFTEKKYTLDKISKISLSRVNLFRKQRDTYRMIKVKLVGRRKTLRIRPIAYWNNRELVQEIMRLKRTLLQ